MTERNVFIIQQRNLGKTLAEIGSSLGISRQAVDQACKKLGYVDKPHQARLQKKPRPGGLNGPFILREQAKAQGLTYFFTGRLCAQGHISTRYVKNGSCVQCQLNTISGLDCKAERKEYAKRYRQSEEGALVIKKRKSQPDYGKRTYQVAKKNPQRWMRIKLHNLLRAHLKQVGLKKSDNFIKLLGAPLSVVATHLESQFQPGMTWQNQGANGWHYDHIRPCASFDLTDPEQQKQCFHYTNLQPLWAADNLAKSDKWEAVAA